MTGSSSSELLAGASSTPSPHDLLPSSPVLHLPPALVASSLGDPHSFMHAHKHPVLVSIVHTLGLTLALVGNFSVIVIIARTRKLHTASSVLVIILACSDLALSLVWNVVPMVATFSHELESQLNAGVTCDIIGFTWQTTLTVSTLFHSIVALDRYLFIVHPMKYQVYVTPKAITILTSVVLVVAFLLSSFLLVTGNNFQYLPVACMCIGSPIWAALYLTVIFVPSLSVAMFAYQRIWRLCISVFRQDDIEVSHTHTPRMSFSNQIPPLSLSTYSHSKSDLGAISDVEGSDEGNLNNKDVIKINLQHTSNSNSEQTTPTPNKSQCDDDSFGKRTEKNTTTTTLLHRLGSDLSITPVEIPIIPTDLHHHGQHRTRRKSVLEVERKAALPAAEETINIIARSNGVRNSISRDPQAFKTLSVLPAIQTRERKLTGCFNLEPAQQPSCHREQYVTKVTIATSSTDEINKTSPNSLTTPQEGNLFRSNSMNNRSHTGHRGSNYHTITKKLFGSESFLPSLLYVGILMPLTIQPVSLHKHRRLRVCLFVGLPVCILTVSFIPLPASLIYLGFAGVEVRNQVIGNAGILLKLICHLSYALVPSLTSFLLCLNSKPYRKALSQTLHCCKYLRGGINKCFT